jgi:hypothetical protein
MLIRFVSLCVACMRPPHRSLMRPQLGQAIHVQNSFSIVLINGDAGTLRIFRGHLGQRITLRRVLSA